MNHQICFALFTIDPPLVTRFEFILSGPDALKKGRGAGFYIMSFFSISLKKTFFENLF